MGGEIQINCVYLQCKSDDMTINGKILIVLSLMAMGAAGAQELPPTLKPDYCKIARYTSRPGMFFLDSLEARFSRCDTTLTIDDLRCLYYGGGEATLCDAYRRHMLLASRFGRQSRAANEAWWQYQMLTSAVWSTGDGTRRRPLHVRSADEAALVAQDFGYSLWFKVKGRRKFSVAPQQ